MPMLTRCHVVLASVGSLLAGPLVARANSSEIQLSDLRQPFTANDAFFVRYHLPVIPDLDARRWRLEIGGPAAARSFDLSLADLKRGFERVSVAAVNQCSGNRRALFTPRVPGVQWANGAMGNAMRTGVRLRDVLARAGLKPETLEIIFSGADAHDERAGSRGEPRWLGAARRIDPESVRIPSQ
jgi:DMSO/TMAO reductase YedYZ molybdopterin-dependent catalytic subunit